MVATGRGGVPGELPAGLLEEHQIFTGRIVGDLWVKGGAGGDGDQTVSGELALQAATGGSNSKGGEQVE